MRRDQIAMSAMYRSIVDSTVTSGPAGAPTGIWRPRFRDSPSGAPPAPDTTGAPSRTGMYVPVHLRGGGRGGGPGPSSFAYVSSHLFPLSHSHSLDMTSW